MKKILALLILLSSCAVLVDVNDLEKCKHFESGADIAKLKGGDFNYGLFVPYGSGQEDTISPIDHTVSLRYIKFKDSIFAFEEEVYYKRNNHFYWISTQTYDEVKSVSKDSLCMFLKSRGTQIESFQIINCN